MVPVKVWVNKLIDIYLLRMTQKKKIQRLVFPSGIGYDKLKGKVQTKRVNSIFSQSPYYQGI